MTTVEIKSLLHESIENISDKALLLSIKDLMTKKWKKGDKPTTENGKVFDPVVKQLSGWIHSLELPQRWRTDGIAPPNYDCKKLAQKVAVALYQDFSLIPIRIALSIEDGIYLKYKNFDNNKVLEIEVYNDNLDIAAILTRNDEIIKSVDIEKEDFFEIVELLNE
jgi:ankyrin repeat protein